MSACTISPWRATWIVARKELVATFRDKQTTLYTIVLPIALYPFLFWAMIQGALFVQGREEHTQVRLGVATTAGVNVPAELRSALEHPLPRPGPESETVLEAEKRKHAQSELAVMHVEEHPTPLDGPAARAWLVDADARDSSARGTDTGPDAVLWLHAPAVASDEPASSAELYYDSTQAHSHIAEKRTLARLPAYARALREQGARTLGHEPDELEPFRIEEAKDIAAEAHGGAFLLSLILPMLLVVMTVIGAFYPAVDFTAGERERNTAETTMLLPIPRRSVHQGKILAVCACAVLATALNLLALGLSAGHLVNMLGDVNVIDIVLPIGALISVVPLALLFAFFVSAVLTGVAALARTFKEGQALLGPVQMLFIFPAMAGAIPGLELTPALCFVPVVNVVLAFRSLLKGQSLPLEYALTALTLLVLAIVAIWLALRVLSREALLSSQTTFRLADWRKLFGSQGATQ